jgi:hypothetical protein
VSPTFVDRFAEVWRAPTPERLVELLHPDVTLYQPQLPPIRGKAQALREFSRLLAWLPGLHGVVETSSQTGDVVFIEWEMRFRIHRELVSIKAIDRFKIQDELAIERTVYFDQFEFLRAILKHPGLWGGYFRHRFRR